MIYWDNKAMKVILQDAKDLPEIKKEAGERQAK